MKAFIWKVNRDGSWDSLENYTNPKKVSGSTPVLSANLHE